MIHKYYRSLTNDLFAQNRNVFYYLMECLRYEVILLEIKELQKELKKCHKVIEDHFHHLENYRDIAWRKFRENGTLDDYNRGYWKGRADSYQEASYKILGREVDRQHLKLD